MSKRKKGPTVSPHARGGLFTTLTVNKKKSFIYEKFRQKAHNFSRGSMSKY